MKPSKSNLILCKKYKKIMIKDTHKKSYKKFITKNMTLTAYCSKLGSATSEINLKLEVTRACVQLHPWLWRRTWRRLHFYQRVTSVPSHEEWWNKFKETHARTSLYLLLLAVWTCRRTQSMAYTPCCPVSYYSNLC